MDSSSRYRVLRLIGSGGMAQVYEGTLVGARGFERRVAIKRVLPQHAHDEAMCRMFLNEAQLASRLHHSNIVQVFDYGLVDGTEFIVMEFVDGVDLARAARHGESQGDPITEGVALYIVGEVARALGHAHGYRDEHGKPCQIVHRDVSPQNVLLSWSAEVKLSDFGIAVAATRAERTRTGVVKGKASFMAPEQATGERVTSAADMYALGRTLEVLVQGNGDGIGAASAIGSGGRHSAPLHDPRANSPPHGTRGRRAGWTPERHPARGGSTQRTARVAQSGAAAADPPQCARRNVPAGAGPARATPLHGLARSDGGGGERPAGDATKTSPTKWLGAAAPDRWLVSVALHTGFIAAERIDARRPPPTPVAGADVGSVRCWHRQRCCL